VKGFFHPLPKLEASAFSLAVAAKIVHQLLTGLAHCHAAGWLHRDIKPGNVLLSGSKAIADNAALPAAWAHVQRQAQQRLGSDAAGYCKLCVDDADPIAPAPPLGTVVLCDAGLATRRTGFVLAAETDASADTSAALDALIALNPLVAEPTVAARQLLCGAQINRDVVESSIAASVLSCAFPAAPPDPAQRGTQGSTVAADAAEAMNESGAAQSVSRSEYSFSHGEDSFYSGYVDPVGRHQSRWEGGLYCQVCTLQYRAPELIFAATGHDTGVDLWSTGVLFAELLRLAVAVDCDRLGLPVAPSGDALASASHSSSQLWNLEVPKTAEQAEHERKIFSFSDMYFLFPVLKGDLQLMSAFSERLGPPASAGVWPDAASLEGFIPSAAYCFGCAADSSEQDKTALSPSKALISRLSRFLQPHSCLHEEESAASASSLANGHNNDGAPLWHAGAVVWLWRWLGLDRFPLDDPSDAELDSADRHTQDMYRLRRYAEEGLDLTLRLLAYDPARRIQASAALSHPFFAGANMGVDTGVAINGLVQFISKMHKWDADEKAEATTARAAAWSLAAPHTAARSTGKRPRESLGGPGALFGMADLNTSTSSDVNSADVGAAPSLAHLLMMHAPISTRLNLGDEPLTIVRPVHPQPNMLAGPESDARVALQGISLFSAGHPSTTGRPRTLTTGNETGLDAELPLRRGALFFGAEQESSEAAEAPNAMEIADVEVTEIMGAGTDHTYANHS
jgi:serine/threonine protein kinase